MKSLTSRAWWSAAATRAVRTAAQTFVASVATVTVLGDVPWSVVGGTVGLSALLSLATSLGGLPEVDEGER